MADQRRSATVAAAAAAEPSECSRLTVEASEEARACDESIRIARPGRRSVLRSRDNSSVVTDETFNAASHFVGAMLALLGGVQLIIRGMMCSFLIWAAACTALTRQFASSVTRVAALEDCGLLYLQRVTVWRVCLLNAAPWSGGPCLVRSLSQSSRKR